MKNLQVNRTLILGRSFDCQIGNHGWSDTKRARIFARFWARVKRADAKACWVWTGAIASHGYGVFGLDSTRVRAHRFAWWASRGPIPAGVEVCHRCDCHSCVNPDHLFLGSHQDNHLDSVRKGRKRAWGVQKLNAAQVLAIRARAAAGVRQCVLAREFGISPNHASGIVHRRVWVHLAEPAAAA